MDCTGSHDRAQMCRMGVLAELFGMTSSALRLSFVGFLFLLWHTGHAAESGMEARTGSQEAEVCAGSGTSGEQTCSQDVTRENTVFQGLLGTVEHAMPMADLSQPVALGYVACWDVIVDAIELVEALKEEADWAEPEVPSHHDEVGSLRDLGELLAYFFSNGAAAERYVSHKEVFRRVVSTALSLPSHSKSVGGNAALMALRMAKAGATDITLGIPGTEALSNEFTSHGINVYQPSKGAGVNGDLEDDVHLILEWKTGEVWGELVSPRANRLALHSDVANPELWAVEPLMDKLAGSPPSILVVGGLQLMQSYRGWDGGAWIKAAEGDNGDDGKDPGQHPAHVRLKELEERILPLMEETENSSRSPTRIHFEFASVSEVGFVKELDEKVLSLSASLGGNEQELGTLYEYLLNGKVSHVQPHTPRVADTLDKMRFVFSTLRKRRLTRLHVHTLAFQAVVTVKDVWRNTSASMALSSLTALDWVCGGIVNGDKEGVYLILDESFAVSTSVGAERRVFDDESPVMCWDESDGLEVCVSPNLVCRKPDKTIGAGDNISGAGLVLQL